MTHPDHSQYCNCICPEGLSYDKLEQTLNRVRMLHVYQLRDGIEFCTHCLDSDNPDEYASWPCETMEALSNDEWDRS